MGEGVGIKPQEGGLSRERGGGLWGYTCRKPVRLALNA